MDIEMHACMSNERTNEFNFAHFGAAFSSAFAVMNSNKSNGRHSSIEFRLVKHCYRVDYILGPIAKLWKIRTHVCFII